MTDWNPQRAHAKNTHSFFFSYSNRGCLTSPSKMRPRHLVLAATIVSGSLAGMSSCVRSCYSATVYFLGCNPGDIACACKQQPNLMYYAEPCLIQECRNDDLLCKYACFSLLFLFLLLLSVTSEKPT